MTIDEAITDKKTMELADWRFYHAQTMDWRKVR